MSDGQLVRSCYRQQQRCAEQGHASTGFFLREFSNGVRHVYELCESCGGKIGVGGSLPRRDHPDWQSYPRAVDGPSSYADGCRCGDCTRDDANAGAAESNRRQLAIHDVAWTSVSARLRSEREARMTWDEYSTYLHTDRWKKLREHALARFDWRCAACHSPDDLHVHHRTYERVGAEYLTDLTVLCRNCHRTLHDTWNEYEPRRLEVLPRRISTDERITEAIRESGCGGMTKAELAEYLELSVRDVEQHIRELATSGAIQSETGERGRKTWFINDGGVDRYVQWSA